MKKIFIFIMTLIISITALFLTIPKAKAFNRVEESYIYYSDIANTSTTNRFAMYYFYIDNLTASNQIEWLIRYEPTSNGDLYWEFGLNNYNSTGGVSIAYRNNYANWWNGPVWVSLYDLQHSILVFELRYSSNGSNIIADFAVIRSDGTIATKETINIDWFPNSSDLYVQVFNQRWNTSRYTSNGTGGTDALQDFKDSYNMLGGSNPFHVDQFEPRNEYLFGDLVSSFLNIKLAEIDIGTGATLNLTLGLLLLFILGIGALFIIIKVFLGG